MLIILIQSSYLSLNTIEIHILLPLESLYYSFGVYCTWPLTNLVFVEHYKLTRGKALVLSVQLYDPTIASSFKYTTSIQVWTMSHLQILNTSWTEQRNKPCNSCLYTQAQYLTTRHLDIRRYPAVQSKWRRQNVKRKPRSKRCLSALHTKDHLQVWDLIKRSASFGKSVRKDLCVGQWYGTNTRHEIRVYVSFLLRESIPATFLATHSSNNEIYKFGNECT